VPVLVPAVQLSAGEAVEAASKWAMAYSKNPKDADTALGHAISLRALGNKKHAFDVLQTAYIANPNDGERATELGKVALETEQVSLAGKAL